MLKAVRIVLKSYTASFRVPHFHGRQLSLGVPPFSTVFGLISAAAGRWVLPEKDIPWIGYRFSYKGRGEDLETIISYKEKGPHYEKGKLVKNVFYREFLFDCELVLYLPREWEDYFRRPRFPLLLGRSQDVAYVAEIKNVELFQADKGKLQGILLPYRYVFSWGIPAVIYNLPVAFEDFSHRKILNLQIVGVVEKTFPLEKQPNELLYKDPFSDFLVPIYKAEDLLARDVS
ncbi:type I-B CRISPR-associated protein Cas5b [Thermosulfurimonas sp. F29]|uniref:type I-B CRISPR-associated protein Cas5b n=1 Tax=Thermosulfurimonas sp. F29 TaxID=2867247 RepID=UPI001C83E233|nr:type I-B CRISPR-associated protein Cas5b [Thermosulfurimonas sp. F29]MBX6423905.1 type I-B CRISPR-associated protein Cas5b [Thermosulfurimonas sp. F29]